METEIKIGFSMHPRWLGNGNLQAFVEPLRLVGLSALEFELDQNLPDWVEFKPLVEEAAQSDLELSFHAPFRSPHSIQGFAGSERSAIQEDYRPMLAIAEDWGQRLGSLCTVVLHAAASKGLADMETLKGDTLAFLNWALETFPSIRFALENNSPSTAGEVKLGEQLPGVLAIIEEFGNPRLQACWDLGHDYLNRGVEPPPAEWLSYVIHAHVHDVNDLGKDHFPLIFQRVPYHTWLPMLKVAGRAKIAILELKGGQLKDWEPAEIQALLIGSVSAMAQGVS